MMLVKNDTKNNDHTIHHDDHTRHNEYSVAALNQDIINLRRLCYCLEHRIPTQKNNSDNNDSATTTLMKAKTGGEIKLKRHEIVYLQSKARILLQKIQEDSSQQQHFIREEYREVVNDLKNLVERACKKISSVTEEEEENGGREMNLVDLLISQSKLLSEDSGCDNDEVEESVGENHDEKNDEDDGYGDLGLEDYDQKELLHHNQQQQQENHTNDESEEEEEKSPEEILQEELTEMVSQLKQNTLRMNSQLKSQNETLLEDLGNKTSENLHNVTNVAEKTSDYNKKNKSWKSWFGSYGILISVVGTMCGMYVFMKIFPKRNYYGRSRSSYHYDEYYGNSNSNRYNDNYQSSYSKPKKKNTTPPPPETKDGMRYGGKHYGILPKTYDGAYTEQLEQEYDPPDFSYDGSWTTMSTTTTTTSSSSSSFDSEDEKEKGKISSDSSSDDTVFSYDATAFKKSHHNQKQDQQEEHNNDDKKQKQKRNSDKSSSSWRHQHSNLQSKSRNSRHTKNLQRARRNKPYEEWWDNPEEEEEQDIDSEYEYDNDYDYNNNDYGDEQEKEDSQECEAKPTPETHNNDDADSIVKNNCEINEQSSDEPKLMGKSSDDLRAVHDVDMEEPGCIAAARALKEENEEDAIKAQAVLDHTQNGDNEAQWMKNIKHKVREKEEGQDNNNEREKEEKKNTMPNNLNIDETFQSMLQRAQKWYKSNTQQQIELKRRDLFHLSSIGFERHPNHEPNTFRDILKEFPLLSFVCDNNGWFAIHEAARGRSLKTMKELVKHSIDFLVLEGENMGDSSLDQEEKIRKELTQKYLNLRTNFDRGGNVLSWVGDSDSDDELVMYLKENGAIRIKD